MSARILRNDPVNVKRRARRIAHKKEYLARERAYRANAPESYKRRIIEYRQREDIIQRKRAQGKENRELNRVKRLDYYMRHFYGITLDEYNRKVVEQNNLCAICGRPDEQHRLSVDHHHVTKQVRDLLCGHCNRGIGLFGEDIDRLKAAAAYLEKHDSRGR